MKITNKQLSDIESALYLAKYFCNEREGGSHQEQNQRDWETYNAAIETIKQIKDNHAYITL